MKNKKKFSLHKLFADNRFVLVLSIFIAIIFWASVCILFSPQTEVVIEDVPVNIELKNSVPEQYGLHMFGDKKYTIDITVSGSRYVVGGRLLSAKDFNVTALTSNVTSAGTHSLQLRVSKANENADFSIDSYSENFINVYFDEYAEKTVNIAVKLDSENVAEEGYIAGNDYIMDSKTTLVGGPAIEISQLDAVIAELDIDSPLDASKAFDASLVAVNETGVTLKYVTFDGEENAKKTVTVPIYKMTTLPLSVNISNAPSSFVGNPVSYTCTPSRLNVAVLQNGTQSESLNVGNIDFASLKPGQNTFSFSVKGIEGIKQDSTSVSTIDVVVSVPEVQDRTLSLRTENISVLNAPDGKTLKFTNSRISNVVLYGNKDELDKIDSAKLQARIDLKNVSVKDGSNQVTVPVYLKETETCWAYGEYKIKFTIK